MIAKSIQLNRNMIARSKQIRSLGEGSIFIISCCTIVALYVASSIWMHQNLPYYGARSLIITKNNLTAPIVQESISSEPKEIKRMNIINTTLTNNNKPWSRKLIHVVTTRFMQGQADLVHLTQARLELFEAICLPSMIGQHLMEQYLLQLSHRKDLEKNLQGENNDAIIDPPFIWVIKVDPNLEKTALSKMIELLKPYPNFFLVGNSINDVIGRWRSDLTEKKILQGTIYSGDLMVLHRAHKFRNHYISLETRLDADDALSLMFLKIVQEQALNSFGLNDRIKNSNGIEEVKWKAWCAM